MKKYASLIIIFHLILLVFLRFTAWPEMILWPYFVNLGLLPYQNIAMAHFPGLIFDLSIFYKLFGVSLISLKVYSWLIVLVTDILIFMVAKKLIGGKAAILSLVFYFLWQPYFEGNGVWFDLMIAPLGLLLFYFLTKKSFFWSGIFFGMAIFVKQTAVWYFLPLLFTFWWLGEIKIKSLTRFFLGVILPLGVLLFYLLFKGIAFDFYFWAIKFGLGYLPRAEGQIKMPGFKQSLALLIPFAPIFLTPLISKKRRLVILFIVWTVFSSFGFLPRFEYFHFQPALPFLAILFGLVFVNIDWHKQKLLKILPIFLLVLGTFYLQARFYRLNWQKPDRFLEKETLEVADWLKAHTHKNQRIFILNSWDHLYALSETLPAVSLWVPTLSWYLEYPTIQEKIVSDLEKNKPGIVVFEPHQEKGLGSYRPEKIEQFLRENYRKTIIIAGRFWILEPIK